MSSFADYTFYYIVDAGKLSNTVFMLEPFGYYVLTDSILVPAGEHLTIAAPEPGLTQETAPPQILCSSKYDGWTKNLNYLFVCEGDLTLKNIWLLYATTSGRQIQACIVFRDNPNNLQKHKCNFDDVIIDYSSIPSLGGGAVTVACKNFTATFTNCYWKNCTDAHFRYYGRAVSFPFNTKGYHIDSLSFENCTFANIGYVLMQESDEYADYVKFNHCTFLNVVIIFCLISCGTGIVTNTSRWVCWRTPLICEDQAAWMGIWKFPTSGLHLPVKFRLKTAPA